MQLGMIGLGRIGASMVRRLLWDGHACVVHDVPPSTVTGVVKDGAVGAASLKELVSQLGRRFETNLPKITEVWCRGSVVGSWSPDLTETALLKDPQGARPQRRRRDALIAW